MESVATFASPVGDVIAAPGALDNTYLQPDGVSTYLQPDGVSLYLQP